MNTILKKYKTDSHRTILMKRGTIFFRDTSVGCLVLNISTGGAGLAVESDVAIPFAFDLEIENEPIRRRCVVVWRLERRLGVTFEFDRVQRPERGPIQAVAGPGRPSSGKPPRPRYHACSVSQSTTATTAATITPHTTGAVLFERPLRGESFGA